MALRKPLVYDGSGEIEQLQPGDSLDERDSALQRSFTSAAIPGQVVYADGNGTVDLAQANAFGTSKILGLALESVAPANPGTVQPDGFVTLTTLQWDAVTGQVGGLVVGTKYYLDPTTPGMMTPTAPTTAGQYVVEIGTALSTTEMDVRRNRLIRL